MQATGIFDPVRLRQEYDAYHLAQGGHICATGMNMSPDWDPDNPYHYHTASGEKVVVKPQDWETHKDWPYFKQIQDAVLAEQTAHPGPEYIINPQFVSGLKSIYKGNMGPLYQNYSSFKDSLPQGYSFTPEGLIQDRQGNLYVQKGFRQTPRFTYDESNPLTFTLMDGDTNKGNVTFYPVNMEMINHITPVSRIMDVDSERNQAIEDYIRNNSGRRYRQPYVISQNDPNHYGVTTIFKGTDYVNTGYTGSKDPIDVNEVFSHWSSDIGYVTKDEADRNLRRILEEKQNNPGLLTGFPNTVGIYKDTVGKLFTPSRKQAKQRAVIEVGPLQINDVQTYSKGGHIHQQDGNVNVLRVNDEGLPEYTLPEITVAYDLPDRNQDKQGFNKYIDSFVKSYTDGNINISDINRLPFKYRNATLGKIGSTRKQEMSSDFVKRKEFQDIQKKIKKYSPAYPLKTSYYSHYWLWNKEIDELRDIEKRMNNGDYWNADEMLQDLNRYEQIVSKRQNYKDAIKERDDYLSNYAGRYLNSRIPFIDPFKEDANSLPSQLFRYAKRHNLFGLNEDKHVSQESKEMIGGKGTDIISLDNNVIRLSPESKQSSALFNEFVETQNPSIYRASDYKQGNVSTFGDSHIPTENVSLFQGVEDGKFKIGNIEDFKDDTYVYPVRNIKKQYSAPIKKISIIQNGQEGISKDYVDHLNPGIAWRTPYDGMVMDFYDQYDPWGGTKKESEAHWNSYNSTENIKYALKKHPEAAKYIIYKDKSGYTYNEIMQLINDGAFSNGNLWFESRMPNYIYAAFDKARNNYPETKRLKEIYDKKFNELLEDTDNPYHTINEIRANLELERTKAYNDFIEKHPGLAPLENRENKYLVTDINDSTYNVSNLNASILDNKMVLGNPNGGVFIGRFQDISQPQLDSLNSYLSKNPSWISRNDLGSFDQYRLDSPSLGEYLKQYYENPSPNDPNVYVVGTTQPNKLWSNEYKEGGSIHIKHPGRLTALKKRTGKTEAELWATGNKDYRRMITFARNSRKWKHQDGGYLDDIIWDNMGQWSHPGQITGITGTKDGTDITMSGVADYLIGKDNLGNVKFMKPGMNYHFPGSSVVEYPVSHLSHKAQDGKKLIITPEQEQQAKMRYSGYFNAMINNGINPAYAKDAAYYATQQSFAEAGWKPNKHNNYGGMKNSKGLISYPSEEAYFDAWVKNANNKWPEYYKSKSIQDWDEYLNHTSLGLNDKQSFSAYQKKNPRTYIYAPAWENDSYLNKMQGVKNRMDGALGKYPDDVFLEYTYNQDPLNQGVVNNQIAQIYQYGGLIKPFSYTDIPVVRYGFGGYSYI